MRDGNVKALVLFCSTYEHVPNRKSKKGGRMEKYIDCLATRSVYNNKALQVRPSQNLYTSLCFQIIDALSSNHSKYRKLMCLNIFKEQRGIASTLPVPLEISSTFQNVL